VHTTNILKGFRARKNLSQEEVGNLMGITRQTYNSLENDILNSDFNLIFKLLNILEADHREVEDFFFALKQDYLSYLQNNKD